MTSASRFSFIGFGALGSALAGDLRAAGVEIKAYVRRQDGATEIGRREAVGVMTCLSVAEAVRDVDVVFAAVPVSAAVDVAHECIGAMLPGTLYVDPSPLHPSEKEELSRGFADVGSDYVDAAVLGTVETEGSRVPILVSGPGAARFAETTVPLGLVVSVLPGPAGRSSLVKLLRSVFTKGRDALILEMLLAARQHNLEAVVLQSFQGKGELVPFPELAARVLGSLVLYADRRADELLTCADVLAQSGIDPIVTQASAARLRRMGRLELRSRFAGERPNGLAELLDALDGLR